MLIFESFQLARLKMTGEGVSITNNYCAIFLHEKIHINHMARQLN